MKNLFRLLLIFLPLYAIASIDVGNWRVSSYDIKTKTAVLGKYLGSSTSVTVPNGITINVFDSSDNKKKDIYFNTKLGSSLFQYNNTIVSVSLGNHSIIPSWCFSGCSSLKNVSGAYGVTMVDGRAFNGCTSLESFEGFATVTNIGSYAFSGCTSLKSVVAHNLKELGSNVFQGCSGLESVSLRGDALIFSSVFSSCSSLRRLELLGNMGFSSRRIYNNPFKGCKSIEEVVFGEGVSFVPESLFESKGLLTNVTVTSSLTNIYDRAFLDCKSLKSLKGADSVTEIGYSAFSGCTLLKRLTGADSVTKIGGSAFSGCSSLESFEGFATVTNIGSSAFSGCSSLRGVIELPVAESVGSSAFQKCVSIISFSASKLINLEDYVFDGCSSLNDVYISGSYVVKRGLFQNCSKLERVKLIGDSAQFADSFFHDDNIHNYWRPPFAGCTNLRDVVLGRNFTSIPRETFNGLSSLTNVTVTSLLTDINDKAFSGCKSLKSLKGAVSVTKIGGSAFSGCSSLESFEGFATVTNIGSSAFSGCSSLTGVIELPVAESVGSSAFQKCVSIISFSAPKLINLEDYVFDGCSSLNDVYISGSYVVKRGLFQNCSKLERVKLIGDSAQFADSFFHSTSTSNYWRPPFSGCTNLCEVVLGENFTWIPRETFNSLQSLTNVTVTSSLTNIYDKAFSGCKSLKSLKGAGSVTGIGSSAFSGCSSLESFEGFAAVTNIGSSAFSGCASLKSVIAHNLKELGSSVFEGCSGLESVSLKGEDLIKGSVFECCSSLRCVEILGNMGFSSRNYHYNDPFEGCKSLEEVVLGEGVSFVPYDLFESKGLLTNVTVTSSLTNIYDRAFSGCKLLKSLKGVGSVTGIGGSAFSGCSSLESFEGFSAVTNIGSSAFSGCSSLTGKVDLVNLKTVESSVFKNCEKLRQVKFGKDLELVRADAFSGSTNLIAFTFEGLPPEADDNAFRNVKKGALGIYPTSTLEFDDAEDKLRSVQTLSETPEKKEWCDVIADDGTWKKLLMAANKPILTNDVYDVKAGSLQLNWENEKAPMPTAKEYGITYEIRRGFTDNYETADILTNGYDQLQYVDKQFDFTGGVSRIWYWVKPEHECTNLFERSDSCRTKNRYGVSVGFSRYKDSDVKGVGFVEAKRVSELAEREGKFEMMFLENERAFYLNVIDKIEGYNKNAKPGDVFFCFIATHGNLGTTTRGPSLRMYDSDGVKNRLYYEDLSRLAKSFVEMKARFIGVIQSCHSQAMVDGGKLLTDEEVTENLEQCGLRECGAYSDYTAWIVSASSQQTSFQYNFDKMSLFSECFVENAWRKKYADIDLHIKGEKIERAYHGDGVVDFRELAEYVETMYQSGNKYKDRIDYRINYTGAKVWNKDLMSSVCIGVVPNGYVYEDKGESLQPPENIDSVLIPDLDAHKQTGKRRFFWDKVEGATRYRLYKTFSGLEKLMPVHVDFPYTTVDEDDNFVRVCFHNVENESCESVKCTYYVQSVNPAGISKLSKPYTLRYIEQKDYEKEFRDYLNEQGFSILSSSSIDEYCQMGNAILVEGAQSLASCFVTGASPHDPNSQFTANITMENGKPKVTPNPDLGDKRRYTIYGKKDLSSQFVDWADMSTVPELEKSQYRFFKVDVSLP